VLDIGGASGDRSQTVTGLALNCRVMNLGIPARNLSLGPDLSCRELGCFEHEIQRVGLLAHVLTRASKNTRSW
jgi:hypothetical protein